MNVEKSKKKMNKLIFKILYEYIIMYNKKFLYNMELNNGYSGKIPLPHHPYHIVDQSP
jgi:hypothetical protein